MHLSPISTLSKLASLFLFGAMVAGSAVRAEVPAFVKESLYSPYAAPVASVVPTLAADVVIIDGGLEQGLRLGMVCSISRGLSSIGELIIIESQSDRAAGLILELVDDSTIQAGDIARVKTIQNS
ncbi:MAG: hypothetical protein NWT02_01570 [Opitutales bacterium]|jgi:hypothetical protein|nr:hypothetical protein [Opitutales bacterium]MDP4694691.1 hypothetical protein [Opitutales bacterium]